VLGRNGSIGIFDLVDAKCGMTVLVIFIKIGRAGSNRTEPRREFLSGERHLVDLLMCWLLELFAVAPGPGSARRQKTSRVHSHFFRF
jgi:hypothetical protein